MTKAKSKKSKPKRITLHTDTIAWLYRWAKRNIVSEWKYKHKLENQTIETIIRWVLVRHEELNGKR